jgi:hypothetical protein
MSNPFILIGTPCYGGLVMHTYMQSVIKLMVYAGSKNFQLGLTTSAHDSLITRSRNSIVAFFLDQPHATHLMFIDADIGFEPEAVERMLDFDQDLVAGMYPLKVLDWSQIQQRAAAGANKDQLETAGLHYVGQPLPAGEREEKNGFVTGLYAGTGFMLIKRQVMEKMVQAYPETKYKRLQTYPPPRHVSDNQYNLFDCIIEPKTGVYLSEDFTFCHRWRQLDGKVWLDTKSYLMHSGSYDFQGVAVTTLG